MHYRSNFLALVGGGLHPVSPTNNVIIWDDAKQRAKFEISFGSQVLNIELMRDRLIVVLLTQVFVYEWNGTDTAPSMLPEYTFSTRENPRGVLAVCWTEGSSLIAFPAIQGGHVQIADVGILRARATVSSCIIKAHTHDIAGLAFNINGRLIATSSTHGKLVRVFDVRSCQQLKEFRRSITTSAEVVCMAFNQSDSKLAVVSSTGTLHLFSLAEAERKDTVTTAVLGQYFGASSERSFALPASTVAACMFSRLSHHGTHAEGEGMAVPCVMVACADASFRVFTVTDRDISTEPAQFFRYLKPDKSVVSQMLAPRV